MAEAIRPELLQFLQGEVPPARVLVIESLSYLPRLRQMYPEAALFAVAADGSAFLDPACANLSVVFTELDYIEEALPFAHESFDYIIADLALEQAGNPQDIAAGFSLFLKQTGSLLTSFRNIRHWSVLKDLMEGHYYHVVSRLFARCEFENLLYASFYKSVRIIPQTRFADDGDDVVERLMAAGFENGRDDLNTEFWLVRADRSMPEMSLLKSLYTKGDRAELSRLLHRIEYAVGEETAARDFWALYRTLGLFPDYVAQFVQEAVYHHVPFYRVLLRHSEGFASELLAILTAAQEDAGEADREALNLLHQEAVLLAEREIGDGGAQ